MKLKLELQDGVTVLRVTEELNAPQVAILRAGLIKIFGPTPAKKSVVLDLCEAKIADTATEIALLQLRSSFGSPDMNLVIAGSNPRVGQAASSAEAIRRITEGGAGVEAATGPATLSGDQPPEVRAKLRLAQLEAQKAALLNRSTGGITDAQFLSLRRENSDLSRSVRELESLISKILAKRATSRAPSTKMAGIRKSLTVVLQQQGVLEIR